MSPINADRAIGGAREAHVGDIALAQVDLRRAARALDEHDIGVRSPTRAKLKSTAFMSFGFRA